MLQGGTTSLLTIAYDQLGRRSSLQRTGAGKTAYAYDNASRLQSLTDQLGTAAGGANDQALTFGYYASDEIRTKTASNTSYSWTGAASTNRPYTINGLNQYTAAGSASFAYDPNGNLAQSSSTFYCYDTENRLIGSGASSTDCSSLAVLAYDPLGRLVTTQAGGTTTRLVYDGDDLVAEYNSAGTLLRRYVHGPGTDDPLVQYEGATVASTAARLLYSDAQGSIIATTDNSGNLMLNGINKYDEYGIPQTDSAGHSLNSGRFQYTGQQWIPELGMYYYKARFYSPTLGRFMQTDPVGYKDQINLYAYVSDDPIDYNDSSGQVIVDSDPNSRDYMQKQINQISRTQYSFDNNGDLHADKSLGVNKHGSGFYSAQLNRAIAGKQAISIAHSQTMTYTEHGTGALAAATFKRTLDVDKQGGGGLTSPDGHQVAITGHTISDHGVPLTPAMDLAHELAGHAIPKVFGGETGNAITDENIIRRQAGLPLRPADPSHTECYCN